jgi:hypothetical protein
VSGIKIPIVPTFFFAKSPDAPNTDGKGVSTGQGVGGIKRLPMMIVLSLSSCCTAAMDGMVPESEWRCVDMVVWDDNSAESSSTDGEVHYRAREI